MSAVECGQLIEVARSIKEPKAAPIVAALTERLENVVGIGLECLSLNRETDTLSGGESQRVRMVKHLGSSLVGVLYIFDEPSVGLHPRDVHRLNELFGKRRDKGKTVIVVEHDPAVIKAADHEIDVGLGAGTNGGNVVVVGTVPALKKSGTKTGKHLAQRAALKTEYREAKGHLLVEKATLNNLHNVTARIPKGVLLVG
jgi:excinuclease UvrABC ATPase subunit